MNIKKRSLTKVIEARPSADGDGVQIMRIAGQRFNADLDPFLMLDEIRSDDSADYIGGFPDHPHRGFETMTYLVQGKMKHKDHLGNEGLLESGDVQWMSAGRGIIHSEMPEQDKGLLHGFQLWLNLPAKEKMKLPQYQDFKNENIPVIELAGKKVEGEMFGRIKVIAGSASVIGSSHFNEMAEDNQRIYMEGEKINKATQPFYLDIVLPADECLELNLPEEHTVLLYVYEGSSDKLKRQQMGVYSNGNSLKIQAGKDGLKALLLAGQPLKEPIAQYGPFVMNTMEEIDQAIEDYKQGNF